MLICVFALEGMVTSFSLYPNLAHMVCRAVGGWRGQSFKVRAPCSNPGSATY